MGDGCSRPIRSNALIIVRSVRTIGKHSSRRGTHELVGFDFREISDLLVLHTFPPGEKLVLADGRPLNATPRLRSAALPMLAWSAHCFHHVTRKQQKRLHAQHALSGNDLKRDILEDT